MRTDALRPRDVLVYRLPLVVIFRMADSVWPRNRLRGLIRFEAQIPLLMFFRAILLSKPVVAEHQVVMSLQVLRVNPQNVLEFTDGFVVFLLQEQNAPGVVADDAILRILLDHVTQMRERIVVSTLGPKDSRIKEMGSGQVWRQHDRLFERCSRSIEISFLNERPTDINETVGIFRISFG